VKGVVGSINMEWPEWDLTYHSNGTALIPKGGGLLEEVDVAYRQCELYFPSLHYQLAL